MTLSSGTGDGHAGQASYPENIQARLIKGIGSNIVSQAVNVVSKIVLVPLFIQAWGSNVYGEWLALSSFVAYLSLAELGGQVYIVNRLTQSYARNDIKEFRRVLHTGMALFLALPLLASALFLIVIAVFPPNKYLQIGSLQTSTIYLVSFLLSLQFACSLPQGILLGIYRAVGMLPRSVVLGTYLLVLQTMFTAVGLWVGGSMIVIALLQIVPFFIVALIAIWEINNKFPEFGVLSIRESSRELGISFLKPSLHFFSIQLSQLLSIQGTILVVSMILGPAQVVVFSTMRTIVNLIKQLLGLVSHTAWPEITRFESQGDMTGEFVLFRAVLRVTMTFAVVAAGIFYLFGSYIYGLWLVGKVAYSHELMALFLIYILQHVFWTVSANTLMAINSHYSLSRIMVISAGLSIVLSFIMARHLGLAGVVMSVIAAEALLPMWIVPMLLKRRHPRFSGQFYIRESVPVLMAACGIVISRWFFIPVIAFMGWWSWCAVRRVKHGLS